MTTRAPLAQRLARTVTARAVTARAVTARTLAVTTLATTLLLPLALATPALAQDTPQPAPEGERAPEGRRRGGPPWMNGAWADEAVEFLARELDLDPSQRAKIKKIMEDSVGEAFRKAAEGFGNGPPDFEKMRGTMEDVRVQVAEKINEVLSPDQRREFEVLVDQFDRRAQSFEQQRRAYEDPTELFDPPPLSRRIVLSKAERALFLGPDETAAVMPLVERVLDLRIALTEGLKVRRDDLRTAIAGGASDDEVRQRLDGLRQSEESQRRALDEAQRALREVLSLEQEVRFVAMGILD